MSEYPAVISDQVQYNLSSMNSVTPRATRMQELFTSDHSTKMAKLTSDKLPQGKSCTIEKANHTASGTVRCSYSPSTREQPQFGQEECQDHLLDRFDDDVTWDKKRKDLKAIRHFYVERESGSSRWMQSMLGRV